MARFGTNRIGWDNLLSFGLGVGSAHTTQEAEVDHRLFWFGGQLRTGPSVRVGTRVRLSALLEGGIQRRLDVLVQTLDPSAETRVRGGLFFGGLNLAARFIL